MWFWKKSLTEAQLWALAAGGILTKMNSEPFDRLRCKHGQSLNRQLLSRDWGINGVKDTTRTLEWLAAEGHSSQCAQYCNAFRKGKDISDSDAYEFLQGNVDRLEAHYIIGWDLSRLINVARWAFTAGYLDEKEAWSWIMHTAPRIQDEYGSWEELGEDFCLGFEFWRLWQSNVGFGLRGIHEKLLRKADSPWLTNSFDTPLS